jgi:hypothetical protein
LPLFPALCVVIGLIPVVYVAIALTASAPGPAPGAPSGNPAFTALTEKVPAAARVLTVHYAPTTGGGAVMSGTFPSQVLRIAGIR